MKKLLCGILAVVSILALLTACGETEDVTTTTTTQASTTTTTKPVTTTQKPTTTTTTIPTTTTTERVTGTLIDPEKNPTLAAELLNLLRINTICASELFFDGQLVNGAGYEYEFANSDEFPNLKALEDFLSEGYIEPIVTYLLYYYNQGKPEYIDIDGKLAEIPVFDGADDVFHWTDKYGGKITDIEMFDDYVLFEGIVYSGYGDRFDMDNYPVGQVWTLRAVNVDGKWKLDPLVPHYMLEEWYYKE